MIGKTNSLSGGDIKGETLKVSLRTNQSSHSDLNGVAFTLEYADSSERYVWEGSDIIIKLPPYLSYTITSEDVDGYKTPSVYSSTSIGGFQKTATLEYKCTIVTVKSDDNQTDYNDVSASTATVSASGMTTKTISNGNSVKVPTGNVCTISWSSVNGYRTPDSQTFTASGTSVTKTGTYQTEILTVNTVTPSGFSGSCTITVSGFGSHSTSTGIYKIPFGTSYTVTASNVVGYKAPSPQSFTANSATRIVTMEYLKGVVDLSMYDIFGNPIQQTTANCYVVKEKGEYMFPMVYGNAIKDGSINSNAYKGASGTNLFDFRDGSNYRFDSPYLDEQANYEILSADLIMSDTDGVFSEISIIDGSNCRYIKFTVESVPETGANGVISATISGGSSEWTWHIWVWADDLTPVTITNATGVDYNILPVNLATKKDANTSGKMYNWFYQWGRHTPMFPPSSYNSTTDATNYGSSTFTKYHTKANIYGDGIRNPNRFYINKTSPYNWFGTKGYLNLWDAACTTTGNSDNDVVKTIYDPCPIGFKVPNGNVFTGFSRKNTIGSYDNGWYFKRNSSDTTGIYFPATGNRYHETGELSGCGSSGCIWLSSSTAENSPASLNFASWTVSPQAAGYRYAIGASIRPVQE